MIISILRTLFAAFFAISFFKAARLGISYSAFRVWGMAIAAAVFAATFGIITSTLIYFAWR